MNGHGPRILESLYFWFHAARQAMRDVDIITHKVALALGKELAQVSWLASEADIAAAKHRAPASVEAVMERDRQRALGTVAVSDLYRILTGEGGVMTQVYDGVGSPVVDAIIDMRAEAGMPLPHRLHLPRGVADSLLARPFAGEEDWSVNESGLYVKRTAFDITSGMEQIIKLEGQVIDSEQTQTVFPYLPAAA